MACLVINVLLFYFHGLHFGDCPYTCDRVPAYIMTFLTTRTTDVCLSDSFCVTRYMMFVWPFLELWVKKACITIHCSGILSLLHWKGSFASLNSTEVLNNAVTARFLITPNQVRTWGDFHVSHQQDDPITFIAPLIAFLGFCVIWQLLQQFHCSFKSVSLIKFMMVPHLRNCRFGAICVFLVIEIDVYFIR